MVDALIESTEAKIEGDDLDPVFIKTMKVDSDCVVDEEEEDVDQYSSWVNWFLSFLLLLIVFGSVFVMWTDWYDTSKSTMETITTGLSSAMRKRIDTQLYWFLGQPFVFARLILSVINDGEIPLSALQSADASVDQVLFDLVLSSGTHMKSLFIGLSTGAFIAATRIGSGFEIGAKCDLCTDLELYSVTPEYKRDTLTSTVSNFNVTERSWYKEVVEAQGEGYTNMYRFTSNEMGITLYKPLYDNANHFIGVIGVDIPLGDLSSLLAKLRSTSTREAQSFVISETGFIIGSSVKENNPESLISTSNIAILLKAYDYFQRKLTYNSTVDGVIIDNFLASFAPLTLRLPDLEWTIIMVIPASDYLESVASSTLASTILTIIIVVSICIMFSCFLYFAPRIRKARLKIASSGLSVSLSRDEMRRKITKQADISRLVSGMDDDDSNISTCDGSYIIRKCRLVRSRNAFFVVLSILAGIVVICMFLLYLNWATFTSAHAQEFNDFIIKESAYHVNDKLVAFMQTPQIINTVLSKKYHRGALDFSFNETALPDDYLHDVMESFKDPVFGNYLVNTIYYGNAAGDIEGASVSIDPITEKAKHIFVASDALNSNCYIEYNVDEDGVRNLSSIIGDPYCPYDASVRPWFTAAADAATYTWTSPYVYPNGVDFGITATLPVYNSTGGLQAVAAVDIDLATLSEFLVDLKESENNHIEIFIYDSSEWMVGNSDSIFTKNVQGSVFKLPVFETTNPQFLSALEYLFTPTTLPRKKQISQDGVFIFTRTMDSPFTAGSHLSDGKGLSVTSILLFDRFIFSGNLETQKIFGVVLAFGTVIVVAIIMDLAFTLMRKQVTIAKGEIGSNDVKLFKTSLGEEEVEEKDLLIVKSELMRILEQTKFAELDEETALETAISFIFSVFNDSNVVISCILRDSKLYFFWSSTKFQFFMRILFFFHMFMLFSEPSHPSGLSDFGLKTWIIGVNLACIGIELFDIIMKFYYNHYLLGKFKFDPDSKLKQVVTNDITYNRDYAHFFVWFCVTINFLITVGARVSLDYFFPLRCLFLLVACKEVFMVTHLFLATLAAARWVFVLYFCILSVATSMAFSMFRLHVNTDIIANSFVTFFQSFVAVTAEISTADNYSSTVYSSVDQFTWIVSLFWVIFTVIAMFFILSMIIAYFQSKFSYAREKIFRKSYARDRIGVVAAFLLIDSNSNGSLSRSEYESFTRKIYLKTAGLADMADHFMFGSGEEMITIKCENENLSVKDFVDGIAVTKHTLRKPPMPRHYCGCDWIKFLQNDTLNSIRLTLCILNILLLGFFGVVDSLKLDIMLHLLILLYFLETITMILLYGPILFFRYQEYRTDVDFIGFSNRVNFFIFLVSVGAYLICISTVGKISFDAFPYLRILFALPGVRVVVLIKGTRVLVKTLLNILPRFWPLVSLLIVIFFVYGVIGVYLFAGKFDYIVVDAPQGSYDSLPLSFLALFELLVGNNWTDAMYAAISVNGWSSVWYFISFILITTILFTNLFLGILLDAFNSVISDFEIAAKASNNELIQGVDIAIINKNLVIARDMALSKIK